MSLRRARPPHPLPAANARHSPPQRTCKIIFIFIINVVDVIRIVVVTIIVVAIVIVDVTVPWS